MHRGSLAVAHAFPTCASCHGVGHAASRHSSTASSYHRPAHHHEHHGHVPNDCCAYCHGSDRAGAAASGSSRCPPDGMSFHPPHGSTRTGCHRQTATRTCSKTSYPSGPCPSSRLSCRDGHSC
uniref:Putative secreted protein n=1 Tax=Anopheles marajoara TaxID=58244 RepID=A0A2M4C787_9DIPT